MLFERIKSRRLLWALLAIVCFTNTGCEESRFNLADDSRLPKWVALPPGLTRANVSLELTFYTMPWGGSAHFILKDKKNRTIEKETGEPMCSGPFGLNNPRPVGTAGFPSYEAVTVKGITEIIEQKKPEPIFYITDDAAVWNQYKSMGC